MSDTTNHEILSTKNACTRPTMRGTLRLPCINLKTPGRVSQSQLSYHVKLPTGEDGSSICCAASTEQGNDCINNAMKLIMAERVGRVRGQGAIEAWPEDPPVAGLGVMLLVE